MPKETRTLSLSQRVVEFSNGTRIEAVPFAGTLTQWRPAAPGLRVTRLAAERDVSLDFEAALEEVGIVEQETIDLDVEGGTAALRSMSRQAAAADKIPFSNPGMKSDLPATVKPIGPPKKPAPKPTAAPGSR